MRFLSAPCSHGAELRALAERDGCVACRPDDFEEIAARAGLGMVAAFYGVARGDAERHVPTTEARNRFGADRLCLRFPTFEAFPRVPGPTPQPTPDG